jgi:hypothetical protein
MEEEGSRGEEKSKAREGMGSDERGRRGVRSVGREGERGKEKEGKGVCVRAWLCMCG